MTGDILLKGIKAVRTINDINLTLAENEKNTVYCNRIQNCLSDITDVLTQAADDMVQIENVENKIKAMNEKLDKYLVEFSE